MLVAHQLTQLTRTTGRDAIPNHAAFNRPAATRVQEQSAVSLRRGEHSTMTSNEGDCIGLPFGLCRAGHCRVLCVRGRVIRFRLL